MNAYTAEVFAPLTTEHLRAFTVDHWWGPRGGLVAVTLPDGMTLATAYPHPNRAADAEEDALNRAVRWRAAALATSAPEATP